MKSIIKNCKIVFNDECNGIEITGNEEGMEITGNTIYGCSRRLENGIVIFNKFSDAEKYDSKKLGDKR